MNNKLHVAMTGDFLTATGQPNFPEFDLRPLQNRSDIDLSYLKFSSTIQAEQLADVDAVVVSDGSFTADSFHTNNRLALIARFGVGYDSIDVDACTKNAVALVNTPSGVRRPVATSILTLMLALTSRLMAKERLARLGPEGWARVGDHHGIGLIGKTLGSIGVGNIGAEMFRVCKPLGMRFMAHDPFVSASVVRELGIEMVDLETLIRNADVLTINCPLLPSTRHLLNAERLKLMKPTSFLINTARGPVIDQRALTEVLQQKRIAGAALDVLEQEPPDPTDPILSLDNIILTPHALCWTDQLFSGCALENVEAVLSLVDGKVPHNIINKEIISDSRWLKKLGAVTLRVSG